jgi:hypothetical protein
MAYKNCESGRKINFTNHKTIFMKKNYLKIFVTAIAVFFTFAYGNAQQGLLWAKNWNGLNEFNDQGYAITTDASGNVYVTGAAEINNSGYSYIETIKYSTSGNIIWQTASPSGGTSGTDVGCAIAVDAHGNTWVAGTAYNGSTYGNNIVLIKYYPSGAIATPNYPKFYQVASGSQISRGTCLAVFDSTDVYVGGALYTNSTSTWALWVDKDKAGGSGWAWTSPYTKSGTSTTNLHSATDLKANQNGVWVTGYINNTSTEQDGWTAELDPTYGTQVWGKALNGAANLNDAANAMYVDGGGNVYVVGYVTASSGYKQAGIIEYSNTSGSVVWSKTVPSTYDGVFTDIAMGQACSTGGVMIYAGGYEEKTISPINYEYLLAAFDNTTQLLSTLWSTNPVTYEGSYTPPVSGTNQGYSIGYEPTTDRVYITGRSDETVGGINITTLGYNACSGSEVWSASYDYNADALLGGVDEMFWKYGMVVKYGACGEDNVYITGESQVSTHGFDYITLDYGYTGTPCGGPMQRVRQTGDEVQTGLYPNPFTTNAVLRLSPETVLSNAVLSVYDISGKLVSNVTNITSTNISINKGDLKSGLYYYTLTDNGTIITKGKFIITD